jgi:hypothetical protein
MSATVFGDAIERLPPEEWLRYFLTRDTVHCPEPPPVTPAALRNAAHVLDDRFDLLGEEHVLPAGFSWKDNPSADTEWQIAHHKFYFAVDLVQAWRQTGNRAYLERWVALIDSWLGEMGSGYITSSDAQVEAKRVEHWVRSFMLLRGTPCETTIPPRFVGDLLTRISDETAYIATHLKPVRNHRTFQLFTVFLVGVLFPEFRMHDEFLSLGRTGLTENLLTDFLADGVHVELSTHYHGLVLETALAFIELARLNGLPVEPALEARIVRALEFAMHVQLPDGGIPLLNDSDNTDHRDALALGHRLFDHSALAWVATLGHAGAPPVERSRHFEDSGYFVFSDDWGSDPLTFAHRQHVVYDCARLGEGSHSHYDLFTFCYHVGAAPAIVDPGRYTYSAAPDADGVDWRHRFKRTASHNTVTIDGKDQTRYISKHGWPRGPAGRAKHGPAVEILDKAYSVGVETDWVSATARSHEYTPMHRRLFVFFRRQYLFIADDIAIADRAPHEYVLRFHLAPRWRTSVSLDITDALISAHTPLFDVHAARPPGMEARVASAWVSERYGIKEPAPALELVQRGAESVWFCSVVAPGADTGYDADARSIRVDRADSGSLLIRVDASERGAPVADWFFVARSTAPAPVQAPFGVCDARFMAWRERPDRATTYLCAWQATPRDGSAWPTMTRTSPDAVEWSAETR